MIPQFAQLRNVFNRLQTDRANSQAILALKDDTILEACRWIVASQDGFYTLQTGPNHKAQVLIGGANPVSVTLL